MAAQLQDVDPIAQVYIGHQQQCHRHQQQHWPAQGQTESATRELHQQSPPRQQHQHAQPRPEEKLREPGAQPGEHATRHHQLLTEERSRGQEQVQLLHFPQQILLQQEQRGPHRQQRSQADRHSPDCMFLHFSSHCTHKITTFPPISHHSPPHFSLFLRFLYSKGS